MRLRPYQREAIRRLRKTRTALLLYRRQAGKTTLFAWLCLENMLQYPGCLNTFVSASLSVGGEVTEREAQLFSGIIEGLKAEANAAGLKLTTNADALQWNDYLDLFSKSKLEVRLAHSNTIQSRTKIIAANIATARGYTGWVFMDEIGFIPDFKGMYGAMEPIVSSDPKFKLIMATTPPDDDSHYSFEIAVPEPGTDFPINPNGNWYESQASLIVHRLDVWDGQAAGVKLYDRDGNAVTPEQHRAMALDRDAWDRNYALKFQFGGSSAITLMAIQSAQQRGHLLHCIAAENDLPHDWATHLGGGDIAIGIDPATTEKQKSNPTGLAIMERTAHSEAAARLLFRFKTSDDRQQKAILTEIVQTIIRKTGRRPRRIVIDGTNERYFAAQIRREYCQYCPVEIMVSSENYTYNNQTLSTKAYLGNLIVSAMEDGRVAIPPDAWVKDDWRLVKRVKGSFDNEVDSAGNHGDTFDGAKNAFHGLFTNAGPAEAAAAQMGDFPSALASPDRSRLTMRPDDAPVRQVNFA